MQPKKKQTSHQGTLPSMWFWGWPEVGEVTSISFKMP